MIMTTNEPISHRIFKEFTNKNIINCDYNTFLKGVRFYECAYDMFLNEENIQRHSLRHICQIAKLRARDLTKYNNVIDLIVRKYPYVVYSRKYNIYVYYEDAFKQYDGLIFNQEQTVILEPYL